MARFHVITDAETGETTTVPFTPEEEAAADAAVVPLLETRVPVVMEGSKFMSSDDGETIAAVLVRVDDHVIVNRIVFTRGTVWEPPEGHELYADDIGMDIGGTYDGETYTPPSE